ncbi:hypothetical protein IMCC3317_20130 [Kordia antarctica]|uniref:Uncharacterized protein n=1 Tax=Kordia antarctica TaxID=1218801 RepID=A0A7L4ZJD2_9FLAO|nr:hypothetical protein IMCC3317_20130 [Kordia antarctica]
MHSIVKVLMIIQIKTLITDNYLNMNSEYLKNGAFF